MKTRTKVAKAIIRDRRSVKELQCLLGREVNARRDAEEKLKKEQDRFSRLFGYRVDCYYTPENDTHRACISMDARAIKSIHDKRALIYDAAAQMVNHIIKSL